MKERRKKKNEEEEEENKGTAPVEGWGVTEALDRATWPPVFCFQNLAYKEEESFRS